MDYHFPTTMYLTTSDVSRSLVSVLIFSQNVADADPRCKSGPTCGFRPLNLIPKYKALQTFSLVGPFPVFVTPTSSPHPFGTTASWGGLVLILGPYIRVNIAARSVIANTAESRV